MMSCVVNRSIALPGEAFSVVDKLFVDPVVVLNFFVIVSCYVSRCFS